MIFLFSTDSFSGTGTSRFLFPLLELLLPWADAEQIEFAHGLVRKLAHVTEYAILSLLMLRALADDERSPVQLGLWAVALCASYAATDEFHQAFVASRTSAVQDVLLDTLGAAIAAGVAVSLGWPVSSGRRSRA